MSWSWLLPQLIMFLWLLFVLLCYCLNLTQPRWCSSCPTHLIIERIPMTLAHTDLTYIMWRAHLLLWLSVGHIIVCCMVTHCSVCLHWDWVSCIYRVSCTHQDCEYFVVRGNALYCMYIVGLLWHLVGAEQSAFWGMGLQDVSGAGHCRWISLS